MLFRRNRSAVARVSQWTACSSRQCAAAAPAASSPLSESPVLQVVPNPQWPRELHFYAEFSHCQEDLHAHLLEEAHRKHGVYLNVPPQLPPPGTPPEVPDVIFCDKQAARLRTIKLVYAPTHGPPPLATTGTRGLEDMIAAEDAAKAKLATQQAGGAGAAGDIGTNHHTPGTSGAPPQVDSAMPTQRRPVDANNRFHCSICAKSFRIRLSADHHVREVHPSNAAAAVLDGPGPGELIIDDPVPMESTSPAANAAKTAAVPSLKLVPVAPTIQVVAYKKLAAAPIPSEEDIDALLVLVWDAAGAARGGVVGSFTPIAEAVTGVADNRKPLSELDLTPSVRATPEGAAPGVKRVASAAATGKFLPIKELSARFPNPFGESEEAKLLALLKDEPVNPFLSAEPLMPEPVGGLVAGSPSLEAARQAKPYRCPLCKTAQFRLLDALADHLEGDHEVEMSIEEILASQDPVAISRNPYVAQKDAPVDGDSGVPSHSSTGNEDSASSTMPLPDGVTADVIPPLPPTEEEVSVHMRAASNTVIVGEVVDVQSGFIKSRRVVQYVVKTSGHSDAAESAPVADEGVPTPPGTSSSSGAITHEFIVVRVDAEGLKFTTDAIRHGMWVMVHGSLRMNRHTDETSRRLHAYPFVHVAAPLGHLMVLE